MNYDPENPIMPRRSVLRIHEEIRSIQEKMGRLQHRLNNLQQELNSQHSRDYGSYTCDKNDTYIMFENGSQIIPIHSEDVVRGKGWFVGIDLAKEETG